MDAPEPVASFSRTARVAKPRRMLHFRLPGAKPLSASLKGGPASERMQPCGAPRGVFRLAGLDDQRMIGPAR